MLSRSGFHFTLANLPNKNGLQLDFSECAKPLSYSTERISEPSPPSWENLQEDLRSCSVVDPRFRNLNQEFSSPVFARHIEDPVALAQITVEVRVAARDLAILKEDAKQRHKKFKESLEVLKEDLEDLT